MAASVEELVRAIAAEDAATALPGIGTKKRRLLLELKDTIREDWLNPLETVSSGLPRQVLITMKPSALLAQGYSREGSKPPLPGTGQGGAGASWYCSCHSRQFCKLWSQGRKY